ncbi:hypothetical protein DAEQUDRAFT_735175 [Daedalea quercina L-15889]|uniref:Uncharacterized protein n=1 Tax=Daedalea quercina L-15889 TaxID=1314783 RepID=A0A165TSN6_9APHY|nr:hypothetical protein DAEQUDRAFT_735175 [Daedalea quercina L-15889]
MPGARLTSENGVRGSGDTSVDTAYASQFSKHLEHVRAHLSGKDRSGRLAPSFFPPGAYWTSAEKDLFFHALAVHSRLRPDLIAEEIKTKSVVDVCLYIQLLKGSTHTDGPMLRKDFQIATQVSDPFITLEEQKAQSILDAEPGWESRRLEETRQLEVEAREKAVRARKGQAQAETNEHYRQDVKRRKKEFKTWLVERKEEWKVEDTLHALNFATLKAMDRILRDEDEASLHAEDELDLLADRAIPEEPETLSVRDDSPAAEEEQAPNGLAQLAAAANVDEDMIDPVLRSQSQGSQSNVVTGASVATPLTHGHHSQSPTVQAHTLPHHQFHPRTLPFRPTFLSPRSSQPISRASSVASGPQAELRLSSVVRRKLQKRLHMRKKRAEARGGSVVSTAFRLKPGRRRMDKALRGPTAYTKPAALIVQAAPTGGGTPDAAAEAIDEEPVEQNGRSPSAPVQDGRARQTRLSGQTLPYRLLRRLREIGLNADKLQEECVGVLSLKGLARLMRLYNRMHDVDPAISSQISSDVIKVLNAHVLHFTVELIHRAIVLREQERESKKHTKGWRLGKFDRISHVHVEQALSLLGCKSITKKEHFEGLLQRLGLIQDDFDDMSSEQGEGGGDSSSEDEDEANDEREADEGDQDGSDCEDEDGDEFDPLVFPLHRVIIPPIVHLPVAELPPSTSGVPRSLNVSLYMPWPASSASAEPPLEEDLMLEETDTDALVEELLDEEQLDEHDQTMEEAYEECLWAELEAVPPPEAQPRPRKKRKRLADDDGEEDYET